jgi:hypothetical protein
MLIRVSERLINISCIFFVGCYFLYFHVLFFGGTGFELLPGRCFPALATPPAHFFLVTLEKGARLVCTMICLFYTSHCHPVFSHWDELSQIFSPGLAWNCNPDFSLLCSLGWQACATQISYWLTWSPMSFFPRLASNLNPPYLSLPSC